MHYRVLILILSLALPMSAVAIEQGQDYWRIELPQSSQINADDNLYFSWMGCQSCRQLEQAIPEALAELEYVPLIVRHDWRAAAKLYYTMQLLEVSEQQQADMLVKIDSGEIDVTDFEAMTAELITMGVDEEALTDLLENKELYRKVQRAEKLAEKYQVQYAPTVVIKGQFATDANHTMTIDRFAEVLRYLQSL